MASDVTRRLTLVEAPLRTSMAEDMFSLGVDGRGRCVASYVVVLQCLSLVHALCVLPCWCGYAVEIVLLASCLLALITAATGPPWSLYQRQLPRLLWVPLGYPGYRPQQYVAETTEHFSVVVYSDGVYPRTRICVHCCRRATASRWCC
jgi:hypothetical protein